MGKNVHITPRANGWAVKSAGSERASVILPTQAQAIDAGRQQAIRNSSELVIHGRDNLIRAKDSHGHGPRKAKG